MQPVDRVQQEARDWAQVRLGFVSFVIWFVLTFGLIVLFDLTSYRRGSILLMVGGLCFLVAALPWVAYPRLVARKLRELREVPVEKPGNVS